MKIKKTSAVILFSALVVCTAQGKNTYSQEQFENLLNIEVGYQHSPEGYLFSDYGCWHGYGFNNPKDISLAGGLRGPAFMGQRSLKIKWLSDCFVKMRLTENGMELPYTTVEANTYIPGMLKQEIIAGSIRVNIKEIAISERSTLTEYEINNDGTKHRTLRPLFTGKISYKDAFCEKTNNENLHVDVQKGKHHFIFSFPEQKSLSLDGKQSYTADYNTYEIAPGKSIKLCVYTTYCPASTEDEALAQHKEINENETAKYFKTNKKRWNGYINSILNKDTPYLKRERNRNWVVKALMTLHTNWRSAAGDLKHGGVQPATGHFDAFWAWDSWEHAAALSVFNPELAKEQMLTMFDQQTPEGMIIDLVSLDKKDNNKACSKPPIAGWGTYMVYRRTNDKEFLREMMPKLLKYHEWRYKYRDHDQNGLCEYGGIDSKVYMGQWESGMDVAVKFNGVKMLKNAEGAYSFDQESIELNSYLCAEKFYLAYMLDELGEKEKAEKFRKEGRKLRKIIQEKFFEKETGFFYDRKLGTGELVKVIDISGWIPLFTGVATKEQAEMVKKNMLDPALFGTYFPFSSLNHKHPQYNPAKGYFRGQTWMNYTYFGIRGWKNYDFDKEAEKYTWLLPDKLKGLTEKGYPIRENWNSSTGEAMTAKHFGWSSAFSILLLCEDADRFPYTLCLE